MSRLERDPAPMRHCMPAAPNHGRPRRKSNPFTHTKCNDLSPSKKLALPTFTRRHAGRLLRPRASVAATSRTPRRSRLALSTILSAVDDMVCSPKPTFAALAVAVQASENPHELTSTVVHDTAAQVTRPRTPSPTHRPTLAPTTHMHTTDHRFARYKAATCAVRFHSCPPRAANTTEYN